jgi:hypothetical protein
VKRFLDENAALFGHGAEVLASARITREFVGEHNGLRTIVWEQRLDGIPLFQSVIIAHITRQGELVNLTSLFLPEVEKAARLNQAGRAALLAAPPIAARQAVVAAAASVGDVIPTEAVIALDPQPNGLRQLQHFTAAPLSGKTRVQLTWLPFDGSLLRLCWQIELTSRRQGVMYLILVDAQSGEVLVRYNLTVAASPATYLVFPSDSPSPFSPGHATPSSVQPALVARENRTWTAFDPTASPDGWINDGEYETVGNNVDAHTDWTGEFNWAYRQDPGPDGPIRASSFPDRVFDPALTLPDQDPMNYWEASVVQLFYWCNWMHDRLYQLGFTEAAGNFQFVNVFNGVDRGGVGGDPLLADAQDYANAGLFNNASMGTPYEDGLSPHMQMRLFSDPSLQYRRDSDLDAEVILHEYTHGLSVRRVGGGAFGMNDLQSQGLGEGWSDFMALALLSEPNDNPNGNYAVGAYVSYKQAGLTENYYYGSRRYPYSTDLTKNPLTFKDIDHLQADPHTGISRSPNVGVTIDTVAFEPHNQGEVWCVALWEFIYSSPAGFIQNITGQPFTITFIGEVLQGHLTRPIPAGLSVRSSMVPQAGGITSLLGFGPEDGLTAGDQLQRFVNLSSSYVIYTYQGASGWYRTTPQPSIPLEPQPALGESFWIKRARPQELETNLLGVAMSLLVSPVAATVRSRVAMLWRTNAMPLW